MVNNTSAQSGCAFACHEANPAGESPALGNPGGEDNYALARSLGVTLRADLLDTAITDLTNQAYSAEHNPSIPVDPVYQMSINSFDVAFNQLVPLTGSFVSTWATQLSSMQTNNTQFLEVYDNNNACVSTSTTSHGVTTTNPCGSGTSSIAQGGSDADTNYDAAMQGITALMPTPGNGTNKAGDTPQEILFIVTDGVEDEDVSRQSAGIDDDRNQGLLLAAEGQGHQDRDSLHGVFSASDQSVVQSAHSIIPAKYRHDAAKLRVVRIVLRGRPGPGHFHGPVRTVSVGRSLCPSDAVS